MANKLNFRCVIPVKGGLGNQMFFYAFYLYLKKEKINAKLIWFHYLFTKHHAGVELFSAFSLSDGLSSFSISFYLFLSKIVCLPIFRRILGRVAFLQYLFYLKVKQINPYAYDCIINQLICENKAKMYIDGFWQNYQYVEFVKDEVLNAFRFAIPSDSRVDSYLKLISDTNSISIHIRRGDYLDPKFQDLNVIKTLDYYIDAIAVMKNRISNPVFFIFTDDVEWCRQQFDGLEFIFVDGNIGDRSYIDMFLMSQCKSNIIANSTFSWWAAWLNNNSNKVVIAPSQWTLEVESSILCPPDWIFLNV